jgi:hypothetical protein
MTAKELKRLRDKSRELYLLRKRQLQQAAGTNKMGSSPYYQGGTGPSGHDAGGMPVGPRPTFAGEQTVKYGVDPTPAEVAKYVEETGGDPYAAKLKKVMERSKSDKSRESLRQRLQNTAGAQGSSQQSVVDQMLGDVKAKIDEANAANDARYDEVKGSNQALYGRVMGEVDNWGGVQSQLNEENAAESLSNQKAYLAARGLSNSNVLPAFQARNDRDLALTQQDLSERKSARRIAYDTDLTNNANAFIERRNDIAPDMAPYYNIALQYAKSGAGQQQEPVPELRKPKRGGRRPSSVNALLASRRGAQLQASVGNAYSGALSPPSYYSGPAYTSNRYPTRRTPEEYAAVAANRNAPGQQLLPTYQRPVSPLQLPGGPPQGMGPYYA